MKSSTLLIAVMTACALSPVLMTGTAEAQTNGMERRDNRRDNRQESRDEKRECKAGDEASRPECRQDKRDDKQEGRRGEDDQGD